MNSGWEGTQFKYKTKTDYTLTVPSDIVIKQFIFGQLGDKTRYDLKVNIEGHKAGTPVVFSFAAGSQPVAWIDLGYEKQTLTTAPKVANTVSTPTEHTNHAVVTLTFDREMADMEATIAGKTVKAKGALGKVSETAGGTSTAITDIGIDSTGGEVEYFNLQGIRVDNPANGIFIRRQGSKAEKIAIR